MYIKMYIKSFFIQALWNFERLQNIGFLFVVKPFLDKVYADKNKRKEALLRHTGFFNTHPYMANVIVALTAKAEKRISETGLENNPDVNLIKSSMAGPLAAIGDSFFWGTIRPVLSFLCIFWVIFFAQRSVMYTFSSYSVVIPITFFMLYNIIHLPVRYWFLVVSFKLDKESIAFISKMEFKVLWEMARYLGLIVILVSLGFYFKIFGFAPINTIFADNSVADTIMFGAVLVLSTIFGRFSATFMFYAVIILCILIAYLGI